MKRQHSQQGFSLLELTLVLVILGLLGMSLWKLLPRMLSLPPVQALLSTDLDRSENALLGHIHIYGRLPCPASEPGGTENCTQGASGWLPERTLGLALEQPLHYRVSSGTPSLMQSQNLYQPDLLELTPASPSNGLDFCRALQQVHAAADAAPLTTGTGSERRPLAYALIDAGRDADGDGDPLDGYNRETNRVMPAQSALTADFDDRQRVAGPLELYGRLQCHSRLGRIQSAVLAANAAYDSERLAQAYVDFREFAVMVREYNVDVAEVGVYIASADLAIATATQLSAIAVAVATNGMGASVIGQAGIQIGAASVAFGAALDRMTNAQFELLKAQEQYYASLEYLGYMEELNDQARDAVLTYDRKGIKP